MPNVTLKLTCEKAIQVHNIINEMTGEASYHSARQQIQKAILAAWPESVDPKHTKTGEARDLELNPKQQRAIAEGLVSLATNPRTTGLGYATIQEVGKACRVWGWVETHAVTKPVEDFDGTLDGEPDLIDPPGEALEPSVADVTPIVGASAKSKSKEPK